MEMKSYSRNQFIVCHITVGEAKEYVNGGGEVGLAAEPNVNYKTS
jgi:hypothetical protein